MAPIRPAHCHSVPGAKWASRAEARKTDGASEPRLRPRSNWACHMRQAQWRKVQPCVSRLRVSRQGCGPEGADQKEEGARPKCKAAALGDRYRYLSPVHLNPISGCRCDRPHTFPRSTPPPQRVWPRARSLSPTAWRVFPNVVERQGNADQEAHRPLSPRRAWTGAGCNSRAPSGRSSRTGFRASRHGLPHSPGFRRRGRG
jgi:hypothetical protein